MTLAGVEVLWLVGKRAAAAAAAAVAEVLPEDPEVLLGSDLKVSSDSLLFGAAAAFGFTQALSRK